ncbi:unnamed protein product [Amoebophrya sp. A25]|nr:unnamed protein product [Amoebophrya sp. A25]|eukprot:GSA25T00004233001.1
MLLTTPSLDRDCMIKRTFTKEEVADLVAKKQRCWKVVGEKIYDVSRFVADVTDEELLSNGENEKYIVGILTSDDRRAQEDARIRRKQHPMDTLRNIMYKEKSEEAASSTSAPRSDSRETQLPVLLRDNAPVEDEATTKCEGTFLTQDSPFSDTFLTQLSAGSGAEAKEKSSCKIPVDCGISGKPGVDDPGTPSTIAASSMAYSSLSSLAMPSFGGIPSMCAMPLGSAPPNYAEANASRF